MQPDSSPRRRGSLLWVVLALGAFAYVAVIDVARVHARGPSLANEELLVLGRHARLERGRLVRCEAEGTRVLGELLALPGELVVASDEGIEVRARATDGFGGTLERLSTQQRRIAALPGRVLIADEALGEPVSMPRKSCLPVLMQVSVARLLQGDFGVRQSAPEEEAASEFEDDALEDDELPAAASVRAAQAKPAAGAAQSRRGAQTASPRAPQR